MTEQSARLGKQYPELLDKNNNFFEELDLAIDQKGWDNRKLTDAVTHLIHNFEYKTPRLANLINYDKTIPFYTWNEIAEKCSPGVSMFQLYFLADIDGEKIYVKKSDMLKHNLQLKPWKSKVDPTKPMNVKYPEGMKPQGRELESESYDETTKFDLKDLAKTLSAPKSTKKAGPSRPEYQRPMSPDEIIKAADIERAKKYKNHND